MTLTVFSKRLSSAKNALHLIAVQFRPRGMQSYALDCLSVQDYFRKVTGLPISTYFSAYKFRWLVENVDEVQEAVSNDSCLLGTMDTWLIWNLTGGPQGASLVQTLVQAPTCRLEVLHFIGSFVCPSASVVFQKRCLLLFFSSRFQEADTKFQIQIKIELLTVYNGLRARWSSMSHSLL